MVEHLSQRPGTRRRKDGERQTGLPAGFATGSAVAPHHAVVELGAVGIGVGQACGELGPCLPDGIGPAVSGLASRGLVAPLEEMHEEILQVRGQRPSVSCPHRVVDSKVAPSGKKSRSRTCAAVNGHASGKTYPGACSCALPRAEG